MAVIETKYSIGDVVYHASIRTVTKQHPCPDCKGERKWKAVSPAGAEYDFACPRCSANFQSNSDLSLKYQQFEPFTSRLTIGSVRSDSHSDRKVEYMCIETGVGSGSIYAEADLFPTEDEARAAGAIEAKLANTQTEWVAKLYDTTLRLSDYELTSAERLANKDAHSAAMTKIRDFFDDIEFSDDAESMRKLINEFREAA